MISEDQFEFDKEAIVSSRKFALSLYKILAKDGENCFFSPFSIYVALCLMYVGAKGETAKEIGKYLHLPNDKDKFLHSFRLLLNELKIPKLNIATSIFVEKSYNVKLEYKNAITKYFDSESKLLDFKMNYTNAENYINSWVSTKTNEKIKDIIPAGTINENTRMVLVNAIHFKDDWLKKFKKENTRDGTFYLTKEKSVKVPMMNITDNFKFLQKDSYKVLELLYENKDFKMIIILPNEIEGLSKLQEQITHFNLDDILQDLQLKKVAVTLPKFKLEKFSNLNYVLQKLGIQTMFTCQADFSELYESDQEPLFVDNILHKAFIEVNEEGTEAAAVTICSVRLQRSRIVEHIYEFVVNRPYIYFIMKNEINLFMGHVKLLQ